MNFCIVNLGCKVNRVESDAFGATLRSEGWHSVSVQQADLIIINTCTVTGEAEKKTRKAVRRTLRENDHAQIYVTGCASAIDPGGLQNIDERLIVEPDKSKVIERILFPLSQSSFLRVGTEYPTRVGIKVQDGCNNACTFCIVHVARGPQTSKPFAEAVHEIKRYEAEGVKEIVLTGINLGSYCADGEDIVGLLKALLDQTSEVRFRVSSIEPHDISNELIALIAQAQGRICRHLHVPLQSGSSRVLKEMARRYNAQEYQDLIKKLRRQIPTLSLSTDVIVGFPGETEEDFAQTCALVKLCSFSKVHIFPYSKRVGTPAAKRSDHVDNHTKAARVKQLAALADECRSAEYATRCDTQELVLVEEAGKAMTESYYHIEVPSSIPKGALVSATLPKHPLE